MTRLYSGIRALARRFAAAAVAASGLGAVAYGTALMHFPAGVIVGGFGLLGFGLFHAYVRGVTG